MQNFQNTIICSTGAFTGRINGRNYRLALDFADQLECDGYEIMIFSDWYEKLDVILADYRRKGLVCPVIHADKRIGDWMSDETEASRERCMTVWETNCRFGAALNAQKIVCHIWGVPDSDAHIEKIADRCGELMKAAQNYGLDMVAENCFCVYGSPLEHFTELATRYPSIGFTLDTRPAQFHGELMGFMESGLFQSGNIRHIHINDYAGGYKDWDAMYPIPQPGGGHIDFADFFKRLKENGYTGSITLEAPSMRPDSVDTETLNHSLRWIREQMQS